MKHNLPGQLELPKVETPQALTDAQILANMRLSIPCNQKPCDIGLFSDEKDQLDLADMPMFMD